MSIVTGLVHEAGSSTVPPVSSDFSGNDFASYNAMTGSVGDIARDTRTNRLYKCVQVGSDEWFLPLEFCEDIACAGPTHIFVSFSGVVGVGEETVAVLANGVRRSEA